MHGGSGYGLIDSLCLQTFKNKEELDIAGHCPLHIWCHQLLGIAMHGQGRRGGWERFKHLQKM